ncbi:MAG: hypothetical protein FJW88_10475 [Actinobacteria bacterium]|nr:hypothetical protein [Actinomycetota bacterium]
MTARDLSRAVRETEARYERWARAIGLRPSQAQRCPRVVAGLRCTAWRSAAPCACQALDRVLDHARVWLRADGRRVLSAEPYDVTSDDLAALLVCAIELGLVFSIHGASPWNPGATVLLVIERAQPDPMQAQHKGEQQ